MKKLTLCALLWMLTGCLGSGQNPMAIGPNDAAATLIAIDAEAGSALGGVKVEGDGCMMIIRNMDKLIQDGASADAIFNAISMETPVCKFGRANGVEPVGNTGTRRGS